MRVLFVFLKEYNLTDITSPHIRNEPKISRKMTKNQILL